MKIEVNLFSENPELLARFYANALDLNIEEKVALGNIYYSCIDSDGNGFYIIPITNKEMQSETANARFTIKVPSSLEKQQDLKQKGIRLKHAGPGESWFSFNDPQGNEIVIVKE
ncbi:VOC family protein [Bacteroides reticulotermitis]|uniref:VOC family protein n=1 Tax=Bacteroides reticulotermitis TaxID=1133319 RepID=UPI003A85C555